MDEKTWHSAAPTLGPVSDDVTSAPLSTSISRANTVTDEPVTSKYEAGQDKDGVDVDRAKLEFSELQRRLTHASSLHRVQTGQKDVEKGEDEDDFGEEASRGRMILSVAQSSADSIFLCSCASRQTSSRISKEPRELEKSTASRRRRSVRSRACPSLWGQ